MTGTVTSKIEYEFVVAGAGVAVVGFAILFAIILAWGEDGY